MKSAGALLLLASSLIFASGADAPKVTRAKVVNVEKLINTQLAALHPEEPYFLIGTARGTYLEGVGAVFSVEINLAMGPALSPFKASVTKEEVAQHRERKQARLPELKGKMYGVVGNMASLFETMPANEEFILTVTLLRYPWEEPDTTPSQIVMRVPRMKLVEAQRASTKPETVIRVQEY